VESDLEKVLIPRERIARRVAEMGRQIAADLARLSGDGEVVLVPIMTGSIIFVADLMRQLPHKLRIHVATITSYPGRATASQGAHLVGELPQDLGGRHVLIVDDILDSGRTIRLIRDEITRRRPSSIRACVLLRKTIPTAMGTPCEYVGFDIPDEFVVGYGLDYNNFYRNLPDVATLKKEAMG
jgi:hypoxanthine phosphoribosyltransferase